MFVLLGQTFLLTPGGGGGGGRRRETRRGGDGGDGGGRMRMIAPLEMMKKVLIQMASQMRTG